MARSVAWKGLERFVAAFLGGKRIPRGFDFSSSLPDVVAPSDRLGKPNGSVVVECKHSQTQPFVDLIEDLLSNSRKKSITIGNYIFWSFSSLEDHSLEKIVGSTKKVKHNIPKYIADNYAQAKGYSIQGLLDITKPVIRIVVIAKKHSSFRVAYTTKEEINDFRNWTTAYPSN